ncbi:DUF1097 domain-containing protein [Nocardioides sp. GXZ039]|uniref:DUF1097 domain-containing protein n=1 Tax=Nocardioides sp. GXZ039 TaxID=3136018 RepID=UPI0030F39EC2
MSPTSAMATAAGLLAGLSVPLTSALDVPTWLVFLAWSTYFFCGTGTAALRAQFATNSWGILLGAATFAIIVHFEASTWGSAAVVAVAAFCVAQSGRIPVFSAAPGLFIGFAMIAAAVQVADVSITAISWDNPLVLALWTVVLGSVFAVVTEFIANTLASDDQDHAAPEMASEP